MGLAPGLLRVLVSPRGPHREIPSVLSDNHGVCAYQELFIAVKIIRAWCEADEAWVQVGDLQRGQGIEVRFASEEESVVEVVVQADHMGIGSNPPAERVSQRGEPPVSPVGGKHSVIHPATWRDWWHQVRKQKELE